MGFPLAERLSCRGIRETKSLNTRIYGCEWKTIVGFYFFRMAGHLKICAKCFRLQVVGPEDNELYRLAVAYYEKQGDFPFPRRQSSYFQMMSTGCPITETKTHIVVRFHETILRG